MIEHYNLSFLNLQSIEDVLLKVHLESHGLLTEGMSSFNIGMPILMHSELQSLYLILQKYVKLYSQKYQISKLRFINSWFNITYPGNELKIHNHGKIGLSGAFYVSVNKNSVPLIFTDVKIHPYPGLLLIFPSFLDHYTEKEREKRIVISFNTDYEL